MCMGVYKYKMGDVFRILEVFFENLYNGDPVGLDNAMQAIRSSA